MTAHAGDPVAGRPLCLVMGRQEVVVLSRGLGAIFLVLHAAASAVTASADPEVGLAGSLIDGYRGIWVTLGRQV